MASNEGRPLIGTVFVDGTVYRAGDVPSPEHAAKITNPKAWGTADDDQTRQGSAVVDAGAGTSGGPAEPQVSGEDEEPVAGADSDATTPRPTRPKRTR